MTETSVVNKCSHKCINVFTSVKADDLMILAFGMSNNEIESIGQIVSIRYDTASTQAKQTSQGRQTYSKYIPPDTGGQGYIQHQCILCI